MMKLQSSALLAEWQATRRAVAEITAHHKAQAALVEWSTQIVGGGGKGEGSAAAPSSPADQAEESPCHRPSWPSQADAAAPAVRAEKTLFHRPFWQSRAAAAALAELSCAVT